MGAQYQSRLFYCNSRCLPRGNVVARVHSLREWVALFSKEENLVHAEHFVSTLVYLSDIFEKFSSLNPGMQGNHTNIIVVTDREKTKEKA
jgi:hypothetical protein